MVRILIISDIHLWSLPNEHDQFYPIRRKLLEDIKDYTAAKGPISHILISGDIAAKGAKDEYKQATQFINELCKKANCPEHEVYLIPGNHDKDFGTAQSGIRHLIHAGMSSETSNIDTDDQWYDILRNDTKSAQLVYAPFKAYHSFASSYDSVEPLMAKCLDGMDEQYDPKKHKMFIEYQLSNIGAYHINLYGMNTALISDWYDVDDDGKGHKLFLPKLAYNIDAPQEGQINILMMHHPLNRVKNGREIQKTLDKKFQIQIYGHLHRPASDDKGAIHILSGAFQPPTGGKESEYFSVYNILELDVKEDINDDTLNAKLYVEKYNKETFEHLNEESKTFEVKLKKNRENRWLNKQKMEDMEVDKLPEGITKREVRYRFIQSPKATQIMKEFDMYDKNKSLSANSVFFLNALEEQNRFVELLEKLSK